MSLFILKKVFIVPEKSFLSEISDLWRIFIIKYENVLKDLKMKRMKIG
jgi:hypothetical protein